MPVPERQRSPWPAIVGALAVIGLCLLGANAVFQKVLAGTTPEGDARERLLEVEGREIVRGLELENPAPGDLGEALVRRVTGHFGQYGGTILRQEVADGVPYDGETAGEIDVQVTRTGQGTALGQPTDSEPVTICVRFTTEWSRDAGIVTSVGEIGCP